MLSVENGSSSVISNKSLAPVGIDVPVVIDKRKELGPPVNVFTVGDVPHPDLNVSALDVNPELTPILIGVSKKNPKFFIIASTDGPCKADTAPSDETLPSILFAVIF